MSKYRFNVVRLTKGPKKGQVWILPDSNRSLRHAQGLLYGVSYECASYYAKGFLQGETGHIMSPYVKTGRSKHWRGAFYEEEEESCGAARSWREDFHSDG